MTKTTIASRRAPAKRAAVTPTIEIEPLAPTVAEPSAPRAPTKLDQIITALRSADGATIARLVALTGWQVHSVRGVLAGTLKTRHGLTITSEKIDGVRIYRADGPAS